MYRMIFDIIRFNQFALDILQDEDESEVDPSGANGYDESSKTRNSESIGQYLAREGYSDAFKDDYLLPMTAAVWSTSTEKCSLDFPAVTLIRFLWNHHILSTLAARPDWMTIPGGSKQYIDAVMKDFPKDKVHLQRLVVGIEDINDKLILQFEDDDEELFDHVILACHGDQAMAIVQDGGTQAERAVLSGFQTTENHAYLHSDISVSALLPEDLICTCYLLTRV